MIINIDTDSKAISIDGTHYAMSEMSAKTDNTLADLFEKYQGTKEYNGIVAEIQKWYYGNLVRDAWCATSVSYFAHVLNISDQTGKFENVDGMKDFMNKRHMLDCTRNYGGGTYLPKRGDLVFFSSYHKYVDCTHVAVVSKVDHATGEMDYVGGNQSDMICVKHANYLADKYVVAFGRIDY